MGDGGGAFDPRKSAQDPFKRLGKLLAADIDAPGTPRWSTVLTGLRNPWRFWFDPAMNEIWLGDVGQDAAEELDRVTLEPDEPPKNLGWPAYEGTRRFEERELRGEGELVGPVATYGHDAGCSVTGGLDLPGHRVPALTDRYVAGDFCTGGPLDPAQRSGRRRPRRAIRARARPATHPHRRGRPRRVVFSTGDGRILRAVPASYGTPRGVAPPPSLASRLGFPLGRHADATELDAGLRRRRPAVRAQASVSRAVTASGRKRRPAATALETSASSIPCASGSTSHSGSSCHSADAVLEQEGVVDPT
jgi:hypothetical protein